MLKKKYDLLFIAGKSFVDMTSMKRAPRNTKDCHQRKNNEQAEKQQNSNCKPLFPTKGIEGQKDAHMIQNNCTFCTKSQNWVQYDSSSYIPWTPFIYVFFKMQMPLDSAKTDLHSQPFIHPLYTTEHKGFSFKPNNCYIYLPCAITRNKNPNEGF